MYNNKNDIFKKNKIHKDINKELDRYLLKSLTTGRGVDASTLRSIIIVYTQTLPLLENFPKTIAITTGL